MPKGISGRLIATVTAFFVLIATLVITNMSNEFDTAGMLAFRSSSDPTTPVGGAIAEFFVSNLTHLGDTITLTALTLLIAGTLYVRQQRRAAAWFVATAVGSFIITAIAKAVFARPRPEITGQLVEVTSASFPSGHTLRSAVVYALIAYIFMKSDALLRNTCIITGAFIIIITNGLSRIYLGVHWPTDIIGAWCIAAVWLLVCKKLYESKVTP